VGRTLDEDLHGLAGLVRVCCVRVNCRKERSKASQRTVAVLTASRAFSIVASRRLTRHPSLARHRLREAMEALSARR